MATGQAGPRGALAARRVAKARGREAGLVLTQPHPREASHVQEVEQIPGFAICVNVQVLEDKHRFINT